MQDDSKETVKIYSMTNPLTGMVFYVGASIRPEGRFKVHINGAEWNPITHRYKQIRLLKAAKVKPVFTILCECDILEARDKEQFYIDHFISLGHTLSQKRKSGYPVDRVYVNSERQQGRSGLK